MPDDKKPDKDQGPTIESGYQDLASSFEKAFQSIVGGKDPHEKKDPKKGGDSQ